MFSRCIRTTGAGLALQIALGWSSPAAAQSPDATGSINGTVIDSATSLPIEGAIAFIALSGIGTSTGPGGRFTLPRVPAGERELVISRVGFHRAAIRVRIDPADTLEMTVRLAGYPVPVGEAEVVAEAPDAPPSPPLFFPDGGEKSWCAYGSETEVPVGILYTEKLLFFYHLDTVREADEPFIRFWLLVYNGSDDTVDFDAERNVTLDATIGSRRYAGVKPDRSEGRDMDQGESRSLPRNMPVERTLYVMAGQSQLFLDAANLFDMAGGGPWLARFTPQPPEHPHGVNPRHLREVYDRCVHTGKMTRYRIAPASGVDGTIRYPMPGFVRNSDDGTRRNGAQPRFVFTIVTPTSEEHIVFSMH